MYTNPDILNEVANILDDFDLDVIRDIFATQIDDDDSYTEICQNQLKPLTISYQHVLELGDDTDPEDVEVLKERYNNICIMVIDMICRKYGLEFDFDWFETRPGTLSKTATDLYQFFIIDIFYIILGVLNNYIEDNAESISDAFAGVTTNSRDVSNIMNSKTIDPKYVTILANMFDVTDYAFMNMDNDTFFDCISGQYAPAVAVKTLLDDGVLSGDIVRTLADDYKRNLALRSKIAFELIYRIKERGYLKKNPIVIDMDDQQEEAASESVTTTEEVVNDTNSFHSLDPENEI